MPTMPERMAVVETDMKVVKDDVSEIKGDVKTLLNWQSEERGARRQRRAFFAVLMIAAPIIVTIGMKVVWP